MAAHNELGKKGEQFAIEYLLANGYTVLETNWRYAQAEIDIICLKNDLLIIIEVKTRSCDYFGQPKEFVTQKKMRLLVNASNEYILANDLDTEVRFDIISLLKKDNSFEIEHIKDAFYDF